MELLGKNASIDVYRVSTVNYVEFFQLGAWGMMEYWRRFRAEFASSYSFPGTFLSDIYNHCEISLRDIALVSIIAVFLTALRIFLTYVVFLPVARLLKSPTNMDQKIPENLWKGFFYMSTAIYVTYLLLWTGRYPWFSDPISIFESWSPLMEIPRDIYILYAVEFGFYLHSVYATIYMDPIRKDTPIMMAHHFLTLLLIGFSFASRHHMEGALVLMCHDACDVFLEFWKLNSNLRRRDNGRYYRFHDWVANFFFAGFAGTWIMDPIFAFRGVLRVGVTPIALTSGVAWFTFRLYWYPLKVLYATLYGPVAMGLAPDMPFYMIYAVLLGLLLLMDFYWFSLVIIGLIRYAMGSLSEIDDTREFEPDDKKKQKRNGSPSHMNGVVAANNNVRKESTEEEKKEL